MRKSEIEAVFTSNVKDVWNAVTDNKDYGWRSDLAKIEIVDERHFIEYTKQGNATKFTITKKEKGRLYQFDMENKMFTGKWMGEFFETKEGGTKIVFTEKIAIKNPIIEVISYLVMNLKKIQNTYVTDLKLKLEEN